VSLKDGSFFIEVYCRKTSGLKSKSDPLPATYGPIPPCIEEIFCLSLILLLRWLFGAFRIDHFLGP
jgi:hypothetical protein